MSRPAPNPRQAPVASWMAQMIGTIVVAMMAMAFVKGVGPPLAQLHFGLERHVYVAILGAALPAIFYLRRFKASLDADDAAIRARGTPDPTARAALVRRLAIGGALCELPMAVGVLYLFVGGASRWFVGATLITLAVRLSYRPFMRRP